ncbi:MAG: hypothetical protein ACPGUV_09050 [Polyangiales bacterium]
MAGRVGVLQLEPLSFTGVRRAHPEFSPEHFMLRGGYPVERQTEHTRLP